MLESKKYRIFLVGGDRLPLLATPEPKQTNKHGSLVRIDEARKLDVGTLGLKWMSFIQQQLGRTL